MHKDKNADEMRRIAAESKQRLDRFQNMSKEEYKRFWREGNGHIWKFRYDKVHSEILNKSLNGETTFEQTIEGMGMNKLVQTQAICEIVEEELRKKGFRVEFEILEQEKEDYGWPNYPVRFKVSW